MRLSREQPSTALLCQHSPLHSTQLTTVLLYSAESSSSRFSPAQFSRVPPSPGQHHLAQVSPGEPIQDSPFQATSVLLSWISLTMSWPSKSAWSRTTQLSPTLPTSAESKRPLDSLAQHSLAYLRPPSSLRPSQSSTAKASSADTSLAQLSQGSIMCIRITVYASHTQTGPAPLSQACSGQRTWPQPSPAQVNSDHPDLAQPSQPSRAQLRPVQPSSGQFSPALPAQPSPAQDI